MLAGKATRMAFAVVSISIVIAPLTWTIGAGASSTRSMQGPGLRADPDADRTQLPSAEWQHLAADRSPKLRMAPRHPVESREGALPADSGPLWVADRAAAAATIDPLDMDSAQPRLSYGERSELRAQVIEATREIYARMARTARDGVERGFFDWW